MTRPFILVSAHTERESGEFPDPAFSLSQRYADAVFTAGGLPMVLPPTHDPGAIRQAVAGVKGVLLSGGDDVAPRLYATGLPEAVERTVYPSVGGRDLFELQLIEEIFRQGKALFAICRGHQVVNLALGGDLITDLPLQRPGLENHNQCERRFEPVHDVVVEPGSQLARITGLDRLGANSTHHQAVGRIAPPLRATGSSPEGVVEVLELRPEMGNPLPFFLGVQFHPERLYDRDEAHARMFQAFVQACR